MRDEDYEWFIRGGYDPGTVSRVFNPDYKPEMDGDFMSSRIWELVKPKEIDEKKLEKARIAASIGDALAQLAQMYVAGRGAHVKETDASQLATTRFLQEEKELRNLYRQQMDRYNDLRFSTALSEYGRSRAQRREDVRDVREELRRKREFDRRAEQDDIEKEYRDKQLELQQDTLAETKRHRLEVEKQQKTASAIRSSRSTGGTGRQTGKVKSVYVTAHANDGNAQTDPLGRREVEIPVTEDRYKSWLAEAKRLVVSDPAWLDRHPGVLLEKPQMTGDILNQKMTGQYRFNEEALVRAYVQDLYDAQFSAQQESGGKGFPWGTEEVLKNPLLSLKNKIEWLRSNHKLSDREIADALNERGLLDKGQGALSWENAMGGTPAGKENKEEERIGGVW
jgi:hypothetical protein